MEQIDEKLRKAVSAIFNNNGVTTCTLKIVENSEIGLNFMGSIMEVVVVDGNRVINVIVKRGVEDRAFYESFGVRFSYEVENYMYTIFIPRLYEFQKTKHTVTYPHVAKYYGASLEKFHEVFVFENLKNKGYAIRSWKTLLDGSHTALVLKELAGYHAACFAFRDQHPDMWTQLISNGNMNRINHFFRNKHVNEVALSRFGKLETVLVNQGKHSIANHLRDLMENMEKYVEKFTATDEYSIIYHGDVWCNNVMFNYEDPKDSSRPTEIKLIDWQASRLGHLCFDISYFIYMSSKEEVLENVSYYLDLYYAQLSAGVKILGSDPSKLFPHHVFQDQWKKCCPGPLIVISNVLLANYMELDEFPDFVAAANTMDNVYKCADIDLRNVDQYNKRMIALIELCVKYKCF